MGSGQILGNYRFITSEKNGPYLSKYNLVWNSLYFMLFYFQLINFMCMNAWLAYICATRVPGSHRSKKRFQIPVELELRWL